MTKKELILFLRDLEKVRRMLTPAQAAQVPNLFPKLKENQKIKRGERFNSEGQVLEAREDFIPEKNKELKPKFSNFTIKRGK
jgi:hypothetical protein